MELLDEGKDTTDVAFEAAVLASRGAWENIVDRCTTDCHSPTRDRWMYREATRRHVSVWAWKKGVIVWLIGNTNIW